MSKKILIILSILALFMAGILAWYWQRNTYSREYLKLEILVQKEAAGGEEITYVVTYKNNGDFLLEQLALMFEFPAGAVSAEGNQRRQTKDLGELYPGQEKSEEFKARLFGRQGEQKEAKAFLTYRPKNLSARYEAQTSSITTLSSSPLVLEWDIPQSVENLKEFDFSLRYSSTLEYPLTDLLVKVEYPEGFEFISSSPVSVGSQEWDIGQLNKDEEGKISLKGNLQGQLREAKTFKATLGSWKEGVFLPLQEVTESVEVVTPQVFITQLVNGSPTFVASPGDTLHYEISFRNIGEQQLEGLSLASTLEGRAIDLATLLAPQGRFRQGDWSVFWDAGTVPALRSLAPGEESKVEFWVNVRNQWDRISPREKNFFVRNTVILGTAKNRNDVKINTELKAEQQAFYQDEVFNNTGPIPPQVGIPTTYTLVWSLRNRYNDAKNIVMKASLPSEVEPTGKQMPESAQISYNSETREITWIAGEVAAGAGFQTEAPSVAFQIKFIPSAGQRGTVPQLIYEAKAEGEDVFTSRPVSATTPSIPSIFPVE